MTDEHLEQWITIATGSIGTGMDPATVWQRLIEANGEELTERVRAEYEQRVGIIRTLREPATLVDRGIRDWYPGPLPEHRFWPVLDTYLREEKEWPEDVVNSIDNASSRVVSLLQPPGRRSYQTRGLVLGYVQSGKTANFTATIAKAADVGYRLFVVLSGVTNSLRAQTQRRLNQELVDLQPELWFTLTDSVHDFKALAGVRANAVLTDRSHLKLLAVVKKNATILRRLRDWLSSANAEVIANCPVLIIDDEADQAGLNASKYEEERTRINSLILEILGLLPKHGYVGYTATPFANVLVDPEGIDDLYPRDFIVDLPRSDDYFGPEMIFGRNQLAYSDDDAPDDGLDMIRLVSEGEIPFLRPKGASDQQQFTPDLVSSLERAIRYFWMATAARCARGQTGVHSTMLIHTALYVAVHDAFRPMIDGFQEAVLHGFEQEHPDEMRQFRQVWADESDRVPPDPELGSTSFEELEPYLVLTVAESVTVVDNSRAESRLDYADEKRVRIVVGGNTLSRGLTLEGLVVSYFVRSSGAYDTLLQMGRWFGYRHGYEDLPRIWMTDELAGYFRDLALVEAEIRSDIARYESLDFTPMEMAVRIRVHPSLQVTSRLKMQAAEPVQSSYSGQRPQTILFDHKDCDVLSRNLSAGRQLVSRIRKLGITGELVSNERHVLFCGVHPDNIISFFEDYKFHPENQTMRAHLLTEYITAQNQHGGLTTWNVGIIGKHRRNGTATVDLGLDDGVPLIERSRLTQPERPYAYVGAIMSDDDRFLDLEEGTARPASTGLLLLYPIDKDSKPRAGATRRAKLEAVDHVLGVAAVFPDAEHDTPEYVAVQLPLFDPESIDEPEDFPEEEDETGDTWT